MTSSSTSSPRGFFQDPRSARWRRWVFLAHQWAGLTVGLYLAVVGLTGSLVVFRGEIEQALHPELTRVPTGTTRVALQPLLDQALREIPGARFHTANLPTAPDQSLSFWGHDPGGSSFHAFFDPWTGRFLGVDVAGGNATEWLYELHANLLAGSTGQAVNGVAAIAAGLLCLTGLVIWWPGRGRVWREGLSFRRGAGWKRRTHELHRVVGFTSLVLLLITIITGIWFPFKAPFRWAAERLTGTSAHEDSPSVSVPSPAPPRITLDQAVAAGAAVLPEAPVNWVSLPGGEGEVFTLRKRLPGEWRLEGMNHLHIHPHTATLVRADLHRDRTAAQRLLASLFPLHTGTFGGTFTRWLWVVVGLVPLLLFVTGSLMWWHRVVRPARLRARTFAPAVPATPAAPRARQPANSTSTLP